MRYATKSVKGRRQEFHEYWKTLPKSNLICNIDKHIMCFCSCSGDDFCCGCGHPRPAIPFFGHCLRCGVYLDKYINQENGDFDLTKFYKRPFYFKEIGIRDPWSGSD